MKFFVSGDMRVFDFGNTADGITQAIENNGHEDDADSGFKGPADFQSRQRLPDLFTEATATDEHSQYRQAQGHHDGLIDPQHDRRQGLWQFDFDQHLQTT